MVFLKTLDGLAVFVEPAILGAIIIIYSAFFAAVTSLRPLANRVLKTAARTTLFTTICLAAWLALFFPATSFLNTLGVLGLSEGMAVFFGVFMGILANGLGKKMMGVPIERKPYCMTLEVHESFEKFIKTLHDILTHLDFDLSGFSFQAQSPFLDVYTTTRTSGRNQFTYKLGIECEGRSGGAMARILCYLDDYSKVTTNDYCKELLEAIVALVSSKNLVQGDVAIHNEPDQTYSRLMQYSLGYVDSKIQAWADKRLPQLNAKKMYVFLSLFCGIIVYLIIPYVINWVGSTALWLKDWGPAVSALFTIGSFLKLQDYVSKKLRRRKS
jgi:hypothetical protein